jgi:head-tail adaptor
MLAHELNRKVRFDKRDERGNDGAGNILQTWEPVCTVSASCLPRTDGSEQIISGRLSDTALFTIRVRQSSLTSGVDATCRAVDLRTNEVWNVRSKLDLDGTRRFWTMDAERGVAV